MSHILVTGASGQLGQALKQQYPDALCTTSRELDITNRKVIEGFDWSTVDTVINAAAYTNVDGAETNEGRIAAWETNAVAPANLVRACQEHDVTLVHISSDYVFDGTTTPHTEDEPFSPLNVYGQSKAAGDIIVSTLPKYYILRTSWVIGDGKNFVRTMLSLAEKGISPTVVNDQIGRLSFTSEIAHICDHLLATSAPFGTYNATNDGPITSWADITRQIFRLSEHKDLIVSDTSTADYFAGKSGIAQRPLDSTLALDKLHTTGFISRDWRDDLTAYISKEMKI